MITPEELAPGHPADADKIPPAWHEHELARTASRVEFGIDRPIPWPAARDILARRKAFRPAFFDVPHRLTEEGAAELRAAQAPFGAIDRELWE